MSENTRIGHPKEHLLPTDEEGFDSLAELALDLRSSWNHESRGDSDTTLKRRSSSLIIIWRHAGMFSP